MYFIQFIIFDSKFNCSKLQTGIVVAFRFRPRLNPNYGLPDATGISPPSSCTRYGDKKDPTQNPFCNDISGLFWLLRSQGKFEKNYALHS